MISRSSPRYSIIKLRALLTFYIYYNKFFKICQICIKTHNTKKKQTKRSRCKKKMLEEFFLFLIHFQNILEPMSTCSLIDDIFEFGGLKMKVENKMRISDYRSLYRKEQQFEPKFVVAGAGFEPAIFDL